jgi:hypothetical protein
METHLYIDYEKLNEIISFSICIQYCTIDMCNCVLTLYNIV